jgi:hypothetical protein
MSPRAIWTASFVLSIVCMIAGLLYTYALPGEEKSLVPTLLAVPLAIIARISLGQMRKHRG